MVAIVGGGASGALAAIHLLRDARARAVPLEVVLIDRHGRHGLGQAYSTTDPNHLLNTRAGKMSALEDDPGHLVRWARSQGLDVTDSAYLPRETYGRYLRDVLDAAEGRAGSGRTVRRVTGTASALTTDPDPRVHLSDGPTMDPGPRVHLSDGRTTDPGSRVHLSDGRTMDPGPRVHLSDGRTVDADAVVLAVGDRVPAAWPGLPEAGTPRHVADPWAPGALARICDGTPVLVLGTGLTMVDVAVSVTRTCPGTVVYAVSRHGLLPRRHPNPVPPPVPVAIPDGPLGLAALLRAVRVAVRENGGDWAGVVDGLRPQVQDVWTRLTPSDQRRFLGLAARYWEVHRHRIPPATAGRVAELQAAGRLRVVRGRVAGATEVPGGLRVRVDGDAPREIDVGWLVNATGPGAGGAFDPFLDRLVATGRARPDRLGLGLDAGPHGAVLDAAGRPSAKIFTLGPTLRGNLYETTAIPEIRAQAAALAPRLIETLTPRPLTPSLPGPHNT